MFSIKNFLWVLVFDFFILLILEIIITTGKVSFGGFYHFIEVFISPQHPVYVFAVFILFPVLVAGLNYFIFWFEYDDNYRNMQSRLHGEIKKIKSDYENKISKIESKAKEEKKQYQLEFDFTAKKYKEGIEEYKQEREYYQQQLTNQITLKEELISVKKIVLDLKNQVQRKKKKSPPQKKVIKKEESGDGSIRLCTLDDVEREEE